MLDPGKAYIAADLAPGHAAGRGIPSDSRMYNLRQLPASAPPGSWRMPHWLAPFARRRICISARLARG